MGVRKTPPDDPVVVRLKRNRRSVLERLRADVERKQIALDQAKLALAQIEATYRRSEETVARLSNGQAHA